jgi:hypothetical protein
MGIPPQTQEAGPWLTVATPRGATVADKCKSEKKALDKATKERDIAEGRFWEWERTIEGWEAEAERALGSAISDCTDSEQRLDETCVIERWIYAYKLLDAAQRFRLPGSGYFDSWLDFEEAREEEESRKDAYCACVNGETPS